MKCKFSPQVQAEEDDQRPEAGDVVPGWAEQGLHQAPDHGPVDTGPVGRHGLWPLVLARPQDAVQLNISTWSHQFLYVRWLFLYLALLNKKSIRYRGVCSQSKIDAGLHLSELFSGLKAVIFQICYPFLDYFIVLLRQWINWCPALICLIGGYQLIFISMYLKCSYLKFR